MLLPGTGGGGREAVGGFMLGARHAPTLAQRSSCERRKIRSMATLHLRFVSWQPELRRYVPVPDGTEVRVMDRDVFTPDDLIAMDDTVDGRVALPLEPLDEALPDVYFLLRQPDGDAWDTRHRVAEDGTPGLLWDFAPEDLG